MDGSRPRMGLALGCGSARGWAHIGIIEALLERGIRPDIVAGTSIGALVGAAYANGRLVQLQVWARTLTQREVWRLVDAGFRASGVMTCNRLIEAIKLQTGDAPIEELPVPFGAVATDVHTGQEVWITRGPMMNAVRASSAMPGLLTPTLHEGRWLVDGGVVNPIPVSLCRALGADFVIAVDLGRKVDKPGVPAPSRRRNGKDRLNGSSAPGLFDIMARSVNIMQDRITRNRMQSEPPDVLLRPDVDEFQLMDFHRAEEAIEIGRAAVQPLADALGQLPRPARPVRHRLPHTSN